MSIIWENITETGEGSSVDPFCRAVKKELRPEGVVTFYQTDSGEAWAIVGTCNQCGMCEEYRPEFLGTVQEIQFYVSSKDGTQGDYFIRSLRWDHPPGTPLAVTELNYASRPDIPIRSSLIESIPECSYRVWTE